MREKKIVKFSTNQIIFILMLIVNFIVVMLFNCLTPYMSDDFEFDPEISKSFLWIISNSWEKYMTWNGRLIPQTLMIFGISLPKMVFNFVNTVAYILVVVFIYLNARIKKYDYIVLSISAIAMWIFMVSPGQTILWVSGSCNYLWPMCIIMAFITLYVWRTESETTNNVLWFLVFLMLGMVVGLCNENTSGGALLIILYYSVKSAIKRSGNLSIKGHFKDILSGIRIWEYGAFIGVVTGLIVLVSSPGAKIRMAENLLEENQTGIGALVGRIIKINDYVRNDFGILLAIIVVLIIYSIQKKKNAELLYDSMAFLACGLITTYVLILTVTPMDRALFGAGIFLIISFAKLLGNVEFEESFWGVFKIGFIVIGCTCCLYQVISDGVNLVRIMRELNERNELVAKEIEDGDVTIIIPKIRSEWDNRFTFIYKNDVTESKDGWGNRIYRSLYGVEEIIGVEYEEWEEYYQ